MYTHDIPTSSDVTQMVARNGHENLGRPFPPSEGGMYTMTLGLADSGHSQVTGITNADFGSRLALGVNRCQAMFPLGEAGLRKPPSEL